MDAHATLSQLKKVTKVYRHTCSQISLLNGRLNTARTRHERAKSVKRLSFKYTNRLEIMNLERLRNIFFACAAAKCEQIEGLQAKLIELTDGAAEEFIEANSSDKEWRQDGTALRFLSENGSYQSLHNIQSEFSHPVNIHASPT